MFLQNGKYLLLNQTFKFSISPHSQTTNQSFYFSPIVNKNIQHQDSLREKLKKKKFIALTLFPQNYPPPSIRSQRPAGFDPIRVRNKISKRKTKTTRFLGTRRHDVLVWNTTCCRSWIDRKTEWTNVRTLWDFHEWNAPPPDCTGGFIPAARGLIERQPRSGHPVPEWDDYDDRQDARLG